ncbi:extracellular serine proteinase-like [Patiria miniata]|uniref:Peptidase S8/S53 domain-containing protein n=1 Tax=Patiria miniata TaxID=46514 RepID=A0A914B6J7_PATMI|nr:extracellular serine proteinase-like [Patiria miniata]
MDKGFTVAVAAGNENSDACQVYPANFKRDITGAYIGSDYKVETVSGTSEATPIVAGAAAILLSTQKDLTHDQVKAKLLSNATPNVLQTPLPAGSPNLLVYV